MTSMRTMRFPVRLEEYESIPGALAKGIRENVLERTSIMFDDTGLIRRKAGFIQVMESDDLERLAEFMQCDAQALVARSGTIRWRTRCAATIRFGDLQVDKSHVDLERRRIAPITLRNHPYHRESWLFTLLPYCPVSLERLVDECPACETVLAWSRCWGIGVCEWCRTPIPPSDEAPLAPELADHYRLFADLLSPRASVRQAAILRLPTPFHDVEPGAIVSMAVRLGQVCRPEPMMSTRRQSLSRLEAPLLASVVASGTATIRSWPDGITAWARAGFEQNINELAGHHRVRAQIKRLGNPRLECLVQARMVREALPQEFASFVHSAASGRFVTATEFKLKTSVSQKRLDLIREEFEDRRLPGRSRVRSQFNVERVQEFDGKYRTSLRLRSLTFHFNLPTYALEQMVCTGLLPAEQDTAVRTARHGMCVQQASVDALIERVHDKALRGDAPADVVPIRTAARRIGEREKPWAAIFQEICEGRIDFWLSGDTVSSKTIMVRPASLARFENRLFVRRDYPGFPFATMVNHNEAGEILNVTFKYVWRLMDDGHLIFVQQGTILLASKTDVLAFAGKMVSPAELGYAMRTSPRAAGREAAAMGVRRLGCGWSRHDLIERGIIPALASHPRPQPQPATRNRATDLQPGAID